MLYFDNAATGGRKPEQVLAAVQAALRVCANPGRSGHRFSLACARLTEDCRHALNDFFHGHGFDRVVFTKNCTEALNVALFGCLQKGDHVVTTCMEHNSVLRPLHALRQAGIIDLDICPIDKTEGVTTADQIRARIKPNTKAVAITAASNVTGAIPDLAAIRAAIPEGVLLICDGAQACGHLPLNMQALKIDCLAVAGHKGMLGIQGSGALLFSNRVQPAPLCFGGTGSESDNPNMPDFYPDRLEAGTLSFPAVISLLEGTRYLMNEQTAVQTRLFSLTEMLLEGIKKIPRLVAFSRPNPCGIVAFLHRELDSEQVAARLDEEFGIAVRSGLHCAPLMHEALGTKDGGLTRVSFGWQNGKAEVSKLLFALSAL